MSDGESPIDTFKRATAAAVRAVSATPDVEVSFAAEGGAAAGKRVRLPVPSRSLSQEEVARVRGEADAVALKLRHHNAQTHAKRMPHQAAARAAYEAVEQARCEALGALRMAGVAENLDAALDYRYRRQGYDRIRERNEVNLAEVLRLLAREALTGEPPPEAARHVVDLWRPSLENRVVSDIDELRKHIADQEQYARTVRQLLADLHLEADDEELSEQEQGQGSEGEEQQNSG